MSQREIRSPSQLQQWKGVDQRSQPTLVQNGFFVMARGVIFGLSENVERISGKKLALLVDSSIFNLSQFNKNVFVQTKESLRMISVEELINFEETPVSPLTNNRLTEDGNLRVTEEGDTRQVTS